MQSYNKTDTQTDNSHEIENSAVHRVELTLSEKPELTRTDKENKPKSKPDYVVFVIGFLMLFAGIGLFWWNNSRVFMDAHSGSISAVATVVIMLLTAAYVIYAKSQWQVMDGQLDQMKQQLPQLQKSSEAAMKSAEAALLNAQAVIDAERAWVMGELVKNERGLTVASSSVFGQKRTAAFLTLKCKNDGKTPAWLEHVYSRLETSQSNERIKDDIGNPDRKTFVDHGSFGPIGAGKTIERPIDLTCAEELSQANFLSALVVIEYVDVFKSRRETFLGYSIDVNNGNIYRQDALRQRNRNT